MFDIRIHKKFEYDFVRLTNCSNSMEQLSSIRERSLFMRGGGGGVGENLKISIFFSDPPKISTFFSGPPSLPSDNKIFQVREILKDMTLSMFGR